MNRWSELLWMSRMWILRHSFDLETVQQILQVRSEANQFSSSSTRRMNVSKAWWPSFLMAQGFVICESIFVFK